MKVTQIAEFTNEFMEEITGNSNVVNEDLSNIVDAGKTILSSQTNTENFLHSMTDRIARFEISNRLFNIEFPSLYRDNYEWASAREVVDIDLLEAVDTQSWELVDGQEYPDNVFYGASADVKFYNSKTTFTIPISITDVQVKSAFVNRDEFISFFNGLEVAVRNSMTLKVNALARRVINSLIGDTIADDFANAAYSSGTGAKAINLLYLYNNTENSGGTPLTTANCWQSREFLAFAAKTWNRVASYMKAPSASYNCNGRIKNTPSEYMHAIILEWFKSELEFGLDSSSFHDDYVKLKEQGSIETTPFWQAKGTGADTDSFAEISKINIKTAAGNNVECSGIVGVIYDHYAAGITQENPRTTTHYVSSAEFTNEWHKHDCSYFENLNEQAVVFFVA